MSEKIKKERTHLKPKMQNKTVRPTRADKVFAGWATSSGASTAQYQPGDSISVDIGDSVTLYAVWADAPKYKIFVRTTSWQEAEKVYVNVGGSWREAKVISVNTGSWHDSQ